MSPTDCLGITWTDLTARLDECGALARWARAERALSPLASLDDLADTVHDGTDLRRTDRIFIALLRTAAADAGADQDAALVIAHLLANATRKMAISLRDLSPDIDAMIASALWVQIRSFRWQHRRRGFAKGLVLDTKSAVLRELAPERTETGERAVIPLSPAVAGHLAELRTPTCVEPGATPPADDEQELLDVLAWAQRTGVLAADDVALLIELELADTATRRAVADAEGVHERTLRRRCNRAKSVLHDARLAYLAQAA